MIKMKTTAMRYDILEKEYVRPAVKLVSIFNASFLCASKEETRVTVEAMITEDEEGLEF